MKCDIVLYDTEPVIGMVEVEGIPLPVLKPRLEPPLEEYPKVGVGIDRMGVEALGKLTYGDDDMIDIA
jgi:hypothetical protein